ncbi:MAG: exodeoxyribonuclease V subunit gamma, partial [Candidatus Omnitrophica bacterium]|nr:exodeoxyribonuclease V subunit gamma [Candidatus Omnitrophota bacterium]
MVQTVKPTLTLLVGPAGCGKTHLCTEAFEDALTVPVLLRDSKAGTSSVTGQVFFRADGTKPVPASPAGGPARTGTVMEPVLALADDILFILPTAEHRARMIDLVLRRGLPGFFQRRITTFDRALKEFLRLGGIDFATDVTRRIILKEIFRRLDFQYFKDAAQMPGFLELASRTLVELKEYLIRPEELQRRLKHLQERFPEFQFKYEDLAQIYEAYDAELKERNLTDLRDSLRLLEEGLKRGEFTAPKLRSVWIDGFSDFSRLQLAFVEFLTRHAGDVTVTLTIDQDPLRSSLFEIPIETQTALEDMGFIKKWMNENNFRAQNQTLKRLEQSLFREEPVIVSAPYGAPSGEAKQSDTKCHPRAVWSSAGRALGRTAPRGWRGESGDPESGFPLKASGNDRKMPPRKNVIQIFEATGLLGEIEMIAREIKRLARAYQYHFSDIAVLFRTTDPYIQVIQSVFRRFEIPVEIHERFRLKTSPIARTLASFFEILLNDWTRKDIFNFLKSSYVRSPSPFPLPLFAKGESVHRQIRLTDESASGG